MADSKKVHFLEQEFRQTAQLAFSLLLLTLVAVGVLGFLLGRQVSNTSSTPHVKTISCTQDAMICSDGSSVIRIPPACEFAACPDDSIPTLLPKNE